MVIWRAKEPILEPPREVEPVPKAPAPMPVENLPPSEYAPRRYMPSADEQVRQAMRNELAALRADYDAVCDDLRATKAELERMQLAVEQAKNEAASDRGITIEALREVERWRMAGEIIGSTLEHLYSGTLTGAPSPPPRKAKKRNGPPTVEGVEAVSEAVLPAPTMAVEAPPDDK